MKGRVFRSILMGLVAFSIPTMVMGVTSGNDFQRELVESGTSGVGPTIIREHTEGRAVGIRAYHEELQYPRGLTLDVRGIGYDAIQDKRHNVTALYVLDGTHVTVEKALKIRLTSQSPYDEDDVSHYYLSGVYAGFGGKSEDSPKYDTTVHVKGETEIFGIGNGVQANKDSYILLDGPVDIRMTSLQRADSYAALAEEGRIGIGAKPRDIAEWPSWMQDEGHLIAVPEGASQHTALIGPDKGDIQQPGSRVHSRAELYPVIVHGNLGVLRKNYGLNPNPDRKGTYIDISLRTPDSTWIGGALNEFDESGYNPFHSGIRLDLQQGAAWHHHWQGPERFVPSRDDDTLDPRSYDRKASHITVLYGGDSEKTAGVIYQEDKKPIHIKQLQGYVKVIKVNTLGQTETNILHDRNDVVIP